MADETYSAPRAGHAPECASQTYDRQVMGYLVRGECDCKPAPASTPAPDANRNALEWVVGDDTGSSSLAIWAHMMGVPMTHRRGYSYPHDPSDFGRCYRLLCRVPEWRPRIAEMASHGPVWSALAEAWDELTALYEQEIGAGLTRYSGTASQLYERMKDIEDAAWRGR